MFFRKLLPQSDVVLHVILQTLAIWALVVPTTVAITSSFVTSLSVTQLHEPQTMTQFVAMLSVVETLAFCPILFAPFAAALLKLKEEQAKLERLADTDALTGLLNRRGFEKAAKKVLATAAGQGGCVAALVCDIDHFKSVNDRHGHGFGDNVLRSLGDLLKERFGSVDCATARIGGEEFLALLCVRNPRAAEVTADGLRRAFAERDIVFGGVAARCTLSVGVAAQPAPGALDALVQRADAALYRAKTAGRNRVAA